MKNGHNKDLLKRYLLGSLEEEERQRLEQELLADDDYFEELLSTEDELADSYVNGELGETERDRFEQYSLATPDGRRRLSFAEALYRYVRETPREEPRHATADTQSLPIWKRFFTAPLLIQKPIARFSLAAVLLVIVFGSSWVIVKNLWLRTESRPDISSAAISIPLTPGQVRDTGEIKSVSIAPGVSAIRLELELARDEYDTYDAIVETDEGRKIFTADHLKAQTAGNGRAVIVSLPSGLLPRGDYRVKLNGVAQGRFEEICGYSFRVIASPF